MENDLMSEWLPYPMPKSKVAFLMTCQRLFQTFPKMYFWTFTFVKVYHDWQYAGLFNRIMLDIGYRYSGEHNGLFGVRVVERHETHGLHYHLLLNQRIPVGMIKRLGHKYGLGRLWVKKCDCNTAFYLAKYLTKGETEFYGGGGKKYRMNKWDVVGGWPGAVKKNELVVTSIAVNAIRDFTKVVGQLPFMISRLVYDWAGLYGRPSNWDSRAGFEFMRRCCMLVKKEHASSLLGIARVALNGIFFRRLTWDGDCVKLCIE